MRKWSKFNWFKNHFCSCLRSFFLQRQDSVKTEKENENPFFVACVFTPWKWSSRRTGTYIFNGRISLELFLLDLFLLFNAGIMAHIKNGCKRKKKKRILSLIYLLTIWKISRRRIISSSSSSRKKDEKWIKTFCFWFFFL